MERLIGRGGMGAVYQAEHTRLRRRVAVKMLLDPFARDPAILESFRHEADVIAQLRHPHIVQILDVDDERGEPFFVMEYLDGDTVGTRLRERSRFGIRDAIRIVASASLALAHVHAQGVVHCDLKPTNLFLVRVNEQSDFVKMLDFGVSTDKARSVRRTGSEIVGTPNYMAPEQAYGHRDLDHRVDQFALAAITHELLSGQKAFSGNDTAEVLEAVVSGAPHALSVVAPGVPATFDPVLQRALSKHPKDRYSSISAFAAALENALEGLDLPDPQRRGPPSGRYSMTPNTTEEVRPSPSPPTSGTELPTSVVGRRAAASGSGSREDDRAATPEALLGTARDLWTAGRVDDAVACAERLLELLVHDGHGSLRQQLGSAIPLLDAIFEARAGGIGARLLPGPALADLRSALSPHAARLVARVAGPTTVGDLVAASNMPRRDCIRVIAGLLRRGALVHA